MTLSKKHKKLTIILSAIIISMVVLIFILQLIVSSIVTNKIENALADRDEELYKVEVGTTKMNLFTMTLILKDINITPDSAYLSKLLTSETKHENIFKVSIPMLRIRNIGIIGLIKDKFIDVGDFVLKKAKVEVYTDGRPSPKKVEKKQVHKGLFNLDSIPLPGIGGGLIHKITIAEFGFNFINIIKNDTVFSAKRLNLDFENASLLKNETDSTSFRFKLNDVAVELTDERFQLPGGKYEMSFHKLRYNKHDSTLVFNNLSVKPRYSRTKMVSFSNYQYEIYNADIEKVEVKSINLRDIIKETKIFLSNVSVDNMKLVIFKDKSKPFDESKRPKLPNQLLKGMKQELYIDSINITNSELVYSEKHDLMEELMMVTLGDFNVRIKNITSIPDSINAGTSMSINLVAKLQKTIPMGVDIYFPMKSVSDTFMFSGHLAGGEMKIFNSVLLPVLGLKFEQGSLDKIKFSANANPTYSVGTMTMQYHDLVGDVQKQDMVEKNKFLSWVANSVIIRNNPIKDKDVRVVPMYFERVNYKGIGNY